jgi:anti-sigma factor RsiW
MRWGTAWVTGDVINVAILRRVRDRMECMRIRRVLQSFLDGELDGAQREWVAAHLDACRRCGLDAVTYESLRRRLSGFDQSVDPEAIARLERFVDQLAGEPFDQPDDRSPDIE